MPLQSAERATRARALNAVMIANFVAIAGFGVLFPVFPQYAGQIGASGAEITMAMAAFSLGQLIAGPFWGKLSDRIGRRPVIIASLLLSAVMYLAHVAAATPLALMAARFVGGLASGSFGATFAVAADVSTRGDRAQAMGIVGAGFSLGFIFGPAIGGLVAGARADPGDFAAVCMVAAALSTLAAGMVAALLPETRPHDATAPAQPRVQARALLRIPALAALMAFTLITVSGAAMMESTFVLFADAVLGLGPLAIGLVFAGIGIVSAGAQLALAGPLQRRFGERRLIGAGLVIYAGGLAMMGASSTPAPAVFGVLLTALAFGVTTPALSSLVAAAAPIAAVGAAMGLNQAASALGRVIGPTVAGPIYDAVNPHAPFLVGAAVMAASLALLRGPITPTSTAADDATARPPPGAPPAPEESLPRHNAP